MTRNRKQTSPLCFDLVDLPPEGKDLRGFVTPGELQLTDDEGDSEFQGNILFELHLATVNSGHDLLVTGSVAGVIAGNCDRCDEYFTQEVAEEQICHQYEDVFGKTVDLTDDIREDLLMALPQRYLCHEDCRGLCPMCGQNLNEGDCDCVPITDEELAKDSGEVNPWDELDQLSDN